ELVHLAAREAGRDADVARVLRALNRARLRRHDRGEPEAQDRDGDHDLEQREAAAGARGSDAGAHQNTAGSMRSDSSVSSRGRGITTRPRFTVVLPVSGATMTVSTSSSRGVSVAPPLRSWIAARSVCPPGQK